jgi:hypothetical protein
VERAEAREDRIDPEERQMDHPGAAHVQEAHYGEQDPDESVVAFPIVTPHRLFDAPAKVEGFEGAANELQATVRRDALFGGGDRKIVDASANLAFRYPHNSGRPVSCDEACNSIHDTVVATFNLSPEGVRLFSD